MIDTDRLNHFLGVVIYNDSEKKLQRLDSMAPGGFIAEMLFDNTNHLSVNIFYSPMYACAATPIPIDFPLMFEMNNTQFDGEALIDGHLCYQFSGTYTNELGQKWIASAYLTVANHSLISFNYFDASSGVSFSYSFVYFSPSVLQPDIGPGVFAIPTNCTIFAEKLPKRSTPPFLQMIRGVQL
jgi:hypothetical protein